MRWLLLIIPGGLAVPTTVFLIARHLVHRDTDSVYRASVLGEVQVANAEARRRRAAQRSKELSR